MKRFPVLFSVAALLGIAGCQTSEPPPPAADPALRSGSAVDEQACDFAVAKATKNGDTMVLSSEFSQANTLVVIGVGPNRAKWKCLVKDGKVAEISSLTDEGAL